MSDPLGILTPSKNGTKEADPLGILKKNTTPTSATNSTNGSADESGVSLSGVENGSEGANTETVPAGRDAQGIPLVQDKPQGVIENVEKAEKDLGLPTLTSYLLKNVKHLYEGVKKTAEEQPVFSPSAFAGGVFSNWMNQASEGKDNIVGAYANTVKSMADATKESAKQTAESANPLNPIAPIEQKLNFLTGSVRTLAEGAMTAGMLTPAGMAFVGGIEALKGAGVPEETINHVFSLAHYAAEKTGLTDKGGETSFGVPIPKYAQNLLSLADLTVFAAGMHMTGKTFEAFKKGEIKTPEQKQEVADAYKKVTQADVDASLKVPDNPEAAHTEKKTAEVKRALPDLPEEVVPLVVEQKKIEEVKAKKEEHNLPTETEDAKIEKIKREYNEKTGAPLTEKEQKEYQALKDIKDAKPKEGEPKPKLNDLEKQRLEHYENRVEKAGEVTPPIVSEHDLQNGDKITGKLGYEKVTGTVTGVGKHKGKIVIDFVDSNGDERFIYSHQIESVEHKPSAIAESTKQKTLPEPAISEAVTEEQPKTEPNALQIESAGSVLQHPQEGVGSEGSQRGGVEQSQQGEETPQPRTESNGGTPNEEKVNPPTEEGKLNVNVREPVKEETKKVYHGTAHDKALDRENDGLIWFTDNKKTADQYRKRSVLNNEADWDKVEGNIDEITESQSGIDTFAEEQGIDLSKGKVHEGELNLKKPLDLTGYNVNIDDIEKLWDDLHSKGLVDEKWSDIDSEFQQEIKDTHEGNAIWKLLEDENVYDKAKKLGFDGVVINDVGIDGKPHISYGVFGLSKFKDSSTEIPKSKKVKSEPKAEDVSSEQSAETTTPTENVQPEVAKEEAPTEKPKTLSDFIRSKKSENRPNAPTQLGFGLPDKILDEAYERLATAIDNGSKLAEAVGEVVKWVDENFGQKWDSEAWVNELKSAEQQYADKKEIIDAVRGEPKEPELIEPTKYDDPQMTKMANAVNDAYVEGKFGIEALDEVIKKLQDTNLEKIYNEIKTKIKSGVVDVEKTRERVMRDQQGSEQDQAVLLYDAAELKGKEGQLLKEINTATDLKTKTELQENLIKVQDAMMDNALANRSIGRSASSIFRLRQLWVDKSANLLKMLEEFQASKGTDKLTKEQETEVKDYYNKLKELEGKIKDLQEVERKTREENIKLTEENEALRQLSEQTKEQRKAERHLKSEERINRSQSRIEQSKQKLRQLRSQLSAGVNPQVAIEIGKIAAEKVLVQPSIKFGELVGNVLDEVKDIFPEFTEDDIRKHILHKRENKPRSEPSKIMAVLKKTGLLEDKLASKDLTKPERKTYEKSPELLSAEKEYAKARLKWDAARRDDLMANRSTAEKVKDSIIRWQRFAVLSYPSTIAKLAAVVGHGLVLKPFRVAMQSAFYNVAKTIAPDFAGRTQIFGKPRISSLAKYYSEFLRNFSKERLTDEFKGVDELEYKYGKPFIYDEWKAASGWMEIPGRSHGYIKSFIKRPEFKYAQEQLVQHYLDKTQEIDNQLRNANLSTEQRAALAKEKERWDATTEENRDIIGRLALQHGKWSILMNDNKLVDATRKWMNDVPYLGFIAKTELPIIKIPTNYVGRAFMTKYGLIQALTGKKFGYDQYPGIAELMFKGTKELKPEQADLLARAIQQGTIGTSLFVAAYLLHNQIKKKDDKTWEIFGKEVPEKLIHVPEYESILTGAELGDKNKDNTDAFDYISNYVTTEADVLKKMPFSQFVTYGFLPNVIRAFEENKKDKTEQKITDAIARKLFDMMIPGFVKEGAKVEAKDTKGMYRKPEGDLMERFWQRFETYIPFLREKVKEAPIPYQSQEEPHKLQKMPKEKKAEKMKKWQ